LTQFINKPDLEHNVGSRLTENRTIKAVLWIKMASANQAMFAAGATLRRRFGLAKISAHVNAFTARSGFAGASDRRSYNTNGFVHTNCLNYEIKHSFCHAWVKLGIEVYKC
jgi:hypothetical protein